MNFYNSIARKIVLPGLVFLLSYTSVQAQNAATGEQLYRQQCQSCHRIDGVGNAPALRGFLERGPWADRQKLYAWIHNPPAFMANDPYTQGLKAQYGYVMTPFPSLSEKDIDAIVEYIVNYATPEETAGGGNTDTGEKTDAMNSNEGAVTFGIISLILAVVALILLQVNSNLKKLSDDREHISRPEPVPFYRNKIYIALLALVFFVIGGFYIAKATIKLGRQKDYQPDQPIYYSHKVHVGINQINCLYCHSAATESRHATIPSINVCMNCHQVVHTYEKGPKLYTEDGQEIDGTAEINKLFAAAGFTPGPGAKWDPTKAKPVDWIKVHNLPDHVYFNHAQHVTAGKVACQTCHGNIQDMDVVKQSSELSMGWCINCHRETKVDFFNSKDSSGNRFYSIYEKFQNDLRPDTVRNRFGEIIRINKARMDSVTVKDIGGLECQKCHY
jgi:mono/diheme cytochrome c family protein